MIRIIVDLPGAGDRHCGSCPMLTGGPADRATACHVFGPLNREPSPEDIVDPLLRAGACHGAQTFGGLNVVALPMLADEDDAPPSTQPAPSAELTSDELPELVVPPPQGTNGTRSMRESER